MIIYSIIHTITNGTKRSNVRTTRKSTSRMQNTGKNTGTRGFSKSIHGKWTNRIQGFTIQCYRDSRILQVGKQFYKSICKGKKNPRSTCWDSWAKKESIEPILLFFLFLMVFSSLFATLDGGLYASQTCIEYGDQDSRCLEALRLSH